MSIEVFIKEKKSTRCFNYIQIILSACLTLILGSFAVVYTLQQNALAKAYREQDLSVGVTLRQQNVYDSYIDDISERLLVLHENPRSISTRWKQLKYHIRTTTLSALPQIDLNQRKRILLFLYDNHLIRSDSRSDVIQLNGADLSDLQFVDESCNFVNLSLTNVFADHIEFNGCNLEYADFSGSRMIGAKFISTRLGAAKFVGVNLTDAIFPQSNTAGLWFHNAVLVRSRFDKLPQNMKFMNTDLRDNDWKNEDIVGHTMFEQRNIVINTRFPDGTFSDIDSTQLVIDGGAESRCAQEVDIFLYNEPRPKWRQDVRYSNVSLINGTSSGIHLLPVEGHCYFQCPLNNSKLEQAINVRNYSLLIESKQAWFNLSAFFSCPSCFGLVYVEIGFYTDQLTTAGTGPEIISFDATQHNNDIFYQKSSEGRIPANTRTIYIEPGAYKLEEHQSHYCFIDNIQLYIYQNDHHNV